MKFRRRRGQHRHRPVERHAPLTAGAGPSADSSAAQFERLVARAELRAAELHRRLDQQVAELSPELERRAAELVANAYAEAEAVAMAPGDEWAADDAPAPAVVRRSDYVPKEVENRHLVRDRDGLPRLRLVDAGDRLAIWSSLNGGALINPRGPGLRRLGLAVSFARGTSHYARAYRNADLGKGRIVLLKREPDNPHDSNAIALYAPGASGLFGYVQRGRAPALAKRLDGGELLVGVSLRGPLRGRGDDTTLILIGSERDVAALLDEEP